MKPIEYDAHKLGKNLTVTVIIHLTREFKIRMAIAKMLIRAAAVVMDCNIKIEEDRMELKR